MKSLNLVLLFFVLIIGCSCSVDESLNKAQIKAEVTDAFTGYVEHVNSQGLEGAETYFANDERFYWVEDGRIQYPSWDSLASGIRQFYPTVDSVSMQVFESKVTVIDQHYATLYAEYKEDIAMKTGYAFTLDGAMTITMTREKNGWKFLSGHSSIKKPRGGN